MPSTVLVFCTRKKKGLTGSDEAVIISTGMVLEHPWRKISKVCDIFKLPSLASVLSAPPPRDALTIFFYEAYVPTMCV